MLRVIGHPHLKQAGVGRVKLAAAIDEGFGQVAHLGDVKVGRHAIAIGSRKTNAVFGVQPE
jgi:hypothetical protein